MTMKLSTTLIHLSNVSNPINASLINEFYQYLIEIGTSVKYQNQNLKQIIKLARYLGTEKTFYDVRAKDEIISFLNTKIKDINQDPDKKWRTTWNDYLRRIKCFFRWFYNYKLVKEKEKPRIVARGRLTEFKFSLAIRTYLTYP
jgi:hypothetical protein